MNYVEYLSAVKLDNTSLAQPITKQCFMLFSVCVKRASAITENMISSKWPNHFWSQMFIDITGSHSMKNYGDNISVYFILLSSLTVHK